MSLDLTKTPWPEWDTMFPPGKHTGPLRIPLMRDEYAFAQHRVNLHEELIRELSAMLDAWIKTAIVMGEDPKQDPYLIGLAKLIQRAKNP